jgi:hypothetical protein
MIPRERVDRLAGALARCTSGSICRSFAKNSGRVADAELSRSMRLRDDDDERLAQAAPGVVVGPRRRRLCWNVFLAV